MEALKILTFFVHHCHVLGLLESLVEFLKDFFHLHTMEEKWILDKIFVV